MNEEEWAPSYTETPPKLIAIESNSFDLNDPALSVSKGLDLFKEGRLSKDGMFKLLHHTERAK